MKSSLKLGKIINFFIYKIWFKIKKITNFFIKLGLYIPNNLIFSKFKIIY